MRNNNPLNEIPLGKKTSYTSHYQRDLLFPIARQTKREALGIYAELPFQGYDIWNGFELSWLNAKGKPVVACAQFFIPANSPNLIESKSFKLYLNSFNNTLFDSREVVEQILSRDLSAATESIVTVNLTPLSQVEEKMTQHFTGICLDDLDVSCDTYTVEPKFLVCENEVVTETIYSDLLKSNCLVTGQPDWGSLQIIYTGNKIEHAGLLQYIVSFRNHEGFAEHCVEHIFMDIMQHCQPQKLMVYARYTRRGGLDINPYRANYKVEMENTRLCRQ